MGSPWVPWATIGRQALFYCLDVDGHGRLSRRNVSFIDDWTRPREETWEEKLGKWQMGTLEETLWLLTFEVSSRGWVPKELVHSIRGYLLHSTCQRLICTPTQS